MCSVTLPSFGLYPAVCHTGSPLLSSQSFVVAQLVEALRYKPGGRGFDLVGISHWLNPSSRTNGAGIDTASSRNEYRGYLLGVKAAAASG